MTLADFVIVTLVLSFIGLFIYRKIKYRDETECSSCSYKRLAERKK